VSGELYQGQWGCKGKGLKLKGGVHKNGRSLQASSSRRKKEWTQSDQKRARVVDPRRDKPHQYRARKEERNRSRKEKIKMKKTSLKDLVRRV